ncbi:hypothetical protein FBU30_010059 [Linnemannia zychae]|nr:hypothetical protein FBU30_010059 [Linnemannia zychae]
MPLENISQLQQCKLRDFRVIDVDVTLTKAPVIVSEQDHDVLLLQGRRLGEPIKLFWCLEMVKDYKECPNWINKLEPQDVVRVEQGLLFSKPYGGVSTGNQVAQPNASTSIVVVKMKKHKRNTGKGIPGCTLDVQVPFDSSFADKKDLVNSFQQQMEAERRLGSLASSRAAKEFVDSVSKGRKRSASHTYSSDSSETDDYDDSSDSVSGVDENSPEDVQVRWLKRQYKKDQAKKAEKEAAEEAEKEAAEEAEKEVAEEAEKEKKKRDKEKKQRDKEKEKKQRDRKRQKEEQASILQAEEMRDTSAASNDMEE